MPHHLYLRHSSFYFLQTFYLASKSSTSPAIEEKRQHKNRRRKRKKKVMADPKSPLILSNFLYKSILFAIIIALLPLFPPQTPEPKNPTFLSRTWELLHLLLVGIGISYGIFSRRNADPDIDKDKEKDATFKPDSTSHVSRILHISSVFDDEDPKSETWSSQYHRPDPVVVETKPLLLPLRSLKKSGVQNPPPPPPPPPSFGHLSLIPTRRDVKKSFKDELKDLSMRGKEGFFKNGSNSPTTYETKRNKKKKVGFMEKMIVMSDDSESEKESDSSSDAEKTVNLSKDKKVEAKENEVDKKADEFIAKFREQIRLQRIESIKKSSGQRAVKNNTK